MKSEQDMFESRFHLQKYLETLNYGDQMEHQESTPEEKELTDLELFELLEGL
jgi:hypothetical protein